MCIRDSLHRGLLIHAEHDGLFRRVEVEANDVDQLSSNRGSLDSLNVFTRCGLRPRPDQIRCTVAGLTSLAFAIDRQLQCVSPSGRPSCVSRTISSTLLAGIDGLRPRPLATRPNSRNPSAANRLRQPTTVLTATPHSAAILALATPSPANSRALDRTTSRCAAKVDLDNVCKVWRCPSDKASAGAGLFMAQSIARQAPIAIHYTSHRLLARSRVHSTSARPDQLRLELQFCHSTARPPQPVSYTHLRAHETVL